MRRTLILAVLAVGCSGVCGESTPQKPKGSTAAAAEKGAESGPDGANAPTGRRPLSAEKEGEVLASLAVRSKGADTAEGVMAGLIAAANAKDPAAAKDLLLSQEDVASLATGKALAKIRRDVAARVAEVIPLPPEGVALQSFVAGEVKSFKAGEDGFARAVDVMSGAKVLVSVGAQKLEFPKGVFVRIDGRWKLGWSAK